MCLAPVQWVRRQSDQCSVCASGWIGWSLSPIGGGFRCKIRGSGAYQRNSCLFFIAGAFAVCGDGKECRGEHGQGDVPTPGVIFADPVVIQPGPILGELERLPDSPPGSGDSDQLGDRHRRAGTADVVDQLAGLGDRTAYRQQMPVRAGVDKQPVVETIAYAARAARQPLPPAFRRGPGECVDALRAGRGREVASQETAMT
jgi:hypothetical protein